jgi:hypothetical protein
VHKQKVEEDGRARRREKVKGMEYGGRRNKGGTRREGERNGGGSKGEEGKREKEEGTACGAAHRTPAVRQNKSQNK